MAMTGRSKTSTDNIVVAGQSEPILVCKDLSVSYFTRAGEIPAVVGFNLTVMPGQAVGIVGESGCGKSTVALAIMNHLGRNGAITGGEIRFLGRNIDKLSPEPLRRIRGREISMVYQEPTASLNPSMRIGTQLIEVLTFHDGLNHRSAVQRALEMLDAVHLPDKKRIMSAYPHQLSGGQQQRVLIAMALLSRPKLLLLDEPTTALDVTVQAGIIELIKEISAEFGTSMIYISHNLGLILETCEQVTVMYSGQAVEQGPVIRVFDEMRHPYTRGLFHSVPLPGTDRYARPLVPIAGQPPLPHERPIGCYFHPRCDFFNSGTCDMRPIPLEPVDGGGHFVRCARHREIDWDVYRAETTTAKPARIGDTVLEVKGLSKYYEVHDNSLKALLTGRRKRYVKANENLEFDAREAETLAIVGESGCGKSTFAKVLMGLEEATAGQILIHGKDVAHLPVQKRPPPLISDLQIVFQNPLETLNPSHTIGGQIARALKKYGVATTHEAIEYRLFELLDLVQLPRDFAFRKPRQLSGGQKQRVGIARAFGGNATVVVADEPLSALDASVQAAITELLTDIQREKRTTLIFISHDLAVVRYLADRIIVMYLGRIIEQGTTEQVFAPPYHPYTEALLSAIPIPDTSVKKKRIILKGELPSPTSPPSGCPFQTRCPRKIGTICETEEPPIREPAPGHHILCHLPREELLMMEPVFELTLPVPDYGESNADEAWSSGLSSPQSPAPVHGSFLRVVAGQDGDDLKRISGIGPRIEEQLRALGIHRLSQIAGLMPGDIASIDAKLNLLGRIERDGWVEQARTILRERGEG